MQIGLPQFYKALSLPNKFSDPQESVEGEFNMKQCPECQLFLAGMHLTSIWLKASHKKKKKKKKKKTFQKAADFLHFAGRV